MRRLLTKFLSVYLTFTFVASVAWFSFGARFVHAAEGFPYSGQRIVFLGDSITHSGRYIAILEASLEDAGIEAELINLGLPSETCSGLSEDDHPFPRPSVQTRLDRALQLSQPDVVVVCYGMNDGIYHPFSKERFAAYRAGINRIIAKSQAVGAKVVLMTPPPFDPTPLRGKGKLVPLDSPEFSYKQAYENYDDVMKRYAQWIVSQADRVDGVIDLHTAISRHMDTQREADPAYVLTGDGVHPNPQGHAAIADAIGKQWNLDVGEPTQEALRKALRRQQILHAAWLTHVGHDRPGMKPGLPLEEARQMANRADQ